MKRYDSPKTKEPRAKAKEGKGEAKEEKAEAKEGKAEAKEGKARQEYPFDQGHQCPANIDRGHHQCCAA